MSSYFQKIVSHPPWFIDKNKSRNLKIKIVCPETPVDIFSQSEIKPKPKMKPCMLYSQSQIWYTMAFCLFPFCPVLG